MKIDHAKIQLDSSKENLFQTILENKDNLETEMIAKAIKEFIKNHEKYNFEKKKQLEVLSNKV